MDLVFATHNPNKLKEVKLLVPKSVRLLSLADINCTEEIPETATTLEGNAWLKANYVAKNYGYPCFADDTGLMVEALDGAPGVHTARYAGEHRSADDNMDKLLENLESKSNRKASFITVIAMNLPQEEKTFIGEVKGVITTEKRGSEGFGYDPVFLPDGFDKTFAELPLEIKNTVSHRARALQQFVTYLKKLKYINK
ncbi:non-canonical purine NTP diphosphatase [Poritiphilus flavus]|uniref:dITP/XTP pyrophosphatase n=1 Tax=Poritiphilus flavus TaxID=2697053 RepID=A0A6L9EAF2_9FLAO|nr:non-canonical purine NTP diphosphatase [Poritiphilus flavus]NAS11716.1 non-canonical purine NTP diphosphatase [Poritiphilus flavus]